MKEQLLAQFHDKNIEKLGEAAYLIHVPKALEFSQDDKTELQRFMANEANVPPTVNPWNAKSNLLRRQCTWLPPGVEYKFSRQGNTNFDGPITEWPRAVQEVLKYVKDKVEDADAFCGVHANYYPTGKAGVAKHADDEASLVKGAPIFSFTIFPKEEYARPFIVNKKAPKGEEGKIVANSLLKDGDMVVMYGEKFQDDFLHSVPPVSNKVALNAPRINLTVRAFDRTRDSTHVDPKRQKTHG